MSQYRVAVIIVNWNSGDRLARAVASLYRGSVGNWISHLVLVDNASVDASLDLAIARAPPDAAIIVTRLTENIGFGAACNRGVADLAARSEGLDFYLFLNPDTELYGDTFENLFSNPDIADARYGIYGVQLRNAHGIATSCSYFPRLESFWLKGVGAAKLGRSNARLQHHMIDFDHSSSRDVDQVMGAFFLVRTAVFHTLDGFDERFFVYYEEVDFCIRARHAGFLTRFIASAAAYHEGGGTTKNVKSFRLYLSLRSRLAYFAKHHSAPAVLSIRVLTFGPEFIARLLRSWSMSGSQGAAEILAAYRKLIGGHRP